MLEVAERLDCTLWPVIRLNCGVTAAALISVMYRRHCSTGTKFWREMAQHAFETDEHILWDSLSDVIMPCHAMQVTWTKSPSSSKFSFLSYLPHRGLALFVVKQLFIRVIIDEGYDGVRVE